MVRYDFTLWEWHSITHAGRTHQRQASLPILDIIRQLPIELTTASRLKRLDSQELSRLLNLLDQDMNFQVLLKTANSSLQNMDAHLVETSGNNIDQLNVSASKSSEGPRSNQPRSLSSVCPSQLVVDSLDPPLAPFSIPDASTGNTAIGMRFLAPTPPGQVSHCDFSVGAFSSSDLDKLLQFSLPEATGAQPFDGVVGHLNIWSTIHLEDGGASEQSSVWSSLLRVGQQPKTHRYQILPFFYNHRWQLAIFDTSERTLCCCDTMSNRGTSMSTFVVSVALWC